MFLSHNTYDFPGGSVTPRNSNVWSTEYSRLVGVRPKLQNSKESTIVLNVD